MKTALLSRAALAALILAGCATASRASTLGYNTAPVTGSGVGSAYWENFSGVTFTGETPDAASDTLFTATLASSMSGGSTPGATPGDRIYGGSGASGVAFNLTLSITAVQDFNTFTLQLKHTAPSSGVWADYFTVGTINGVSATQELIANSNEGGQQNFNIYQWTWTGLEIQANDVITLTMTGPGAHVSLDGVRIDAAAVPEPSAYAALCGGLALAGVMLRRRRHPVARVAA